MLSLGVVARFGRHAPASSAAPPARGDASAAARRGRSSRRCHTFRSRPRPSSTAPSSTWSSPSTRTTSGTRTREAEGAGHLHGPSTDTTAVIEGHSDRRGNAEHNLILSSTGPKRGELPGGTASLNPRLSRRATASDRVADNSTQRGSGQNRRVDAVVACVTDVEGPQPGPPARMTMALFMRFRPDKPTSSPEYDGELRKGWPAFLKANPPVTATVEAIRQSAGRPGRAMEIPGEAQNVVTTWSTTSASNAPAHLNGLRRQPAGAYNTAPRASGKTAG